MGGLHILYGSARYGYDSIIPLSASNFLVVTYTTGAGIGQLPLTQTIVATDPTVATPVSTTQQTAVIQAEASAYGADTGAAINEQSSQYQMASDLQSQQSNLQTYTNPQYGFSLQYPTSAELQTDPNALSNGMGPDTTLLKIAFTDPSNTVAASFEVSVDSYAPDVAQCLTVPVSSEESYTSKGTTTINGAQFLSYTIQ